MHAFSSGFCALSIASHCYLEYFLLQHVQLVIEQCFQQRIATKKQFFEKCLTQLALLAQWNNIVCRSSRFGAILHGCVCVYVHTVCTSFALYLSVYVCFPWKPSLVLYTWFTRNCHPMRRSAETIFCVWCVGHLCTGILQTSATLQGTPRKSTMQQRMLCQQTSLVCISIYLYLSIFLSITNSFYRHFFLSIFLSIIHIYVSIFLSIYIFIYVCLTEFAKSTQHTEEQPA